MSFYLRRSLRGYMVGTTVRFPLKIMESFAIQSRHRIPRKWPRYHMSTYSDHRRVTGSGHLLNGGLGGYCQRNLPWVLWSVSYGPKLSNTVGSLQRQMARVPYTPYQETTPPLQAE
jgi:hypothetical protein